MADNNIETNKQTVAEEVQTTRAYPNEKDFLEGFDKHGFIGGQILKVEKKIAFYFRYGATYLFRKILEEYIITEGLNEYIKTDNEGNVIVDGDDFDDDMAVNATAVSRLLRSLSNEELYKEDYKTAFCTFTVEVKYTEQGRRTSVVLSAAVSDRRWIYECPVPAEYVEFLDKKMSRWVSNSLPVWNGADFDIDNARSYFGFE